MSHFTCLQLPVVRWIHWNFFKYLCQGQSCGNYQKFTDSERGAKVLGKVSIYIMIWWDYSIRHPRLQRNSIYYLTPRSAKTRFKRSFNSASRQSLVIRKEKQYIFNSLKTKAGLNQHIGQRFARDLQFWRLCPCSWQMPHLYIRALFRGGDALTSCCSSCCSSSEGWTSVAIGGSWRVRAPPPPRVIPSRAAVRRAERGFPLWWRTGGSRIVGS